MTSCYVLAEPKVSQFEFKFLLFAPAKSYAVIALHQTDKTIEN